MLHQENFLFYIAGHSAVGKSTLLSHLINEFPWPIIQKVSTRGVRAGDSQTNEVFPINDREFFLLSEQGLLTARYEKYGKNYAFFSKSGTLKVAQKYYKVVGVDQLNDGHVFAVGDAYHAPTELRKVFSNIYVFLLYARPGTIELRLQEKELPESQLRERIKSLEKECTADGFPIGVPFYDYAISTDAPITSIVKIAKMKIVELISMRI